MSKKTRMISMLFNLVFTVLLMMGVLTKIDGFMYAALVVSCINIGFLFATRNKE